MLLFALPIELPAQGATIRLQTEAALTLSISQEADEALDRAQRWLATQAMPTNRVDALLRAYAVTPPARGPFRLTRCDITPLEHAMPPPESPEGYVDFAATVAQHRLDPKRLFALQRDIPADAPPAGWRETVALALINTQKVLPSGGHWNADPDDTVWAMLALRALLNESTPIQLAE